MKCNAEMPNTTHRMTSVRMMLSRGTVSSRSRSKRPAPEQADGEHDQQDREAGFPIGVNEAHRQQRRRECAERAQSDTFRKNVVISAANGKQQQDLHDRVHLDRQPAQIENLQRILQLGLHDSRVGRQPLDRVTDRQPRHVLSAVTPRRRRGGPGRSPSASSANSRSSGSNGSHCWF